MAKVHPHDQTLSSPSFSCFSSTSTSTSCYVTLERENFTVWLKSLVFQGNGCTVFDSKGRITYRVDNYDKKCCKDVYLMDSRGKVLFSIQQKKYLRILGQWVGYKWSDDCGSEKQAWFQMRKLDTFLGGRGARSCKVYLQQGLLGCDRKARGSNGLKIVRTSSSSSSEKLLAFSIIDRQGRVVAEAKPKQSSSGVPLGEDVLSLMVEPEVDHSLVMAIVTAYGSMNHKL